MNRTILALAAVLAFHCSGLNAKGTEDPASKRIVVEVQFEDDSTFKTMLSNHQKQGEGMAPDQLDWGLLDRFFAVPQSPDLMKAADALLKQHRVSVKAEVQDRKLRWELPGNGYLSVTTPMVGTAIILAPGDSLSVIYRDGRTIFTGAGAAWFQLQTQIWRDLNRSLSGRTRHPLDTSTQDEYFQWMKVLDDHIEFVLSKLEEGKELVPPVLSDRIKMIQIDIIETSRLDVFYALQDKMGREELCNLWDDSIQKNAPWGHWLRSQSDYLGGGGYLYQYNRLAVRRKFGFDLSKPPLSSNELRKTAYYEHARDNFTGMAREKLLQRFLPEQVIVEMGPSEAARKILDDYYQLPGFPENRQWIRDFYEANLQRTIAKYGREAVAKHYGEAVLRQTPPAVESRQ